MFTRFLLAYLKVWRFPGFGFNEEGKRLTDLAHRRNERPILIYHAPERDTLTKAYNYACITKTLPDPS